MLISNFSWIMLVLFCMELLLQLKQVRKEFIVLLLCFYILSLSYNANRTSLYRTLYKFPLIHHYKTFSFQLNSVRVLCKLGHSFEWYHLHHLYFHSKCATLFSTLFYHNNYVLSACVFDHWFIVCTVYSEVQCSKCSSNTCTQYMHTFTAG